MMLMVMVMVMIMFMLVYGFTIERWAEYQALHL